MGPWLPIALVALLWIPAQARAAESPALAQARALYNAGNFDEAIASAQAARNDPQYADAAALVLSRSLLERFRTSRDANDLTSARDTLGAIRSAALSPRDQVDLLIGLGQTLFLSEEPGAATRLFEDALNRIELLAPVDRLRLLDWWATAMDREARGRPADRRAELYGQLVQRMTDVLRGDPANPVGNYWSVSATRALGRLDDAWDAAAAAWVRARLAPASMESHRKDLDQLVTQALIPELARLRPAREQQEAAAALGADWERIKQNWK